MNSTFEILQQCNYWEEAPQQLGYIRNQYIHSLLNYLDNNLIKVLVGQRRAGKSYILRQFIANLITSKKAINKNILYLNFELEKLSFIRSQGHLKEVIELYKEKIQPKGKFFIILDEIQEVDGWEKLINSYLADTNTTIEIFLTGSNSNLLSSELATYIGGRYITKEIHPFSFQEHLGFLKKQNSKESFINYINFSGIPELYNLNQEELRQSFVESLKDTILLRDIVKRYHIQNIDLLEKLFLFLVDNISNLFSLNSLVKTLKSMGTTTNTVTLGNYIKFIENCFILSGANKYDIKGKKILEGEKKYYLNDLCFRNYLSSNFDLGMSKKLENYIYKTLKILGYKVYVGNIGDIEIDFIAEKLGKKMYIQVAYILYDEAVINREYGNLEKINDNWEKIVVSLDDIKLSPRNGIKHIQAWKFADWLWE